MVNLARSDTAWDELAERLGGILGLYRREMCEANWWQGPYNSAPTYMGDVDTSYLPLFYLSPQYPFRLDGLKVGTNTADSRVLYGRIVTDGSGNCTTFGLYTDSARTAAVAAISGTPAATAGTAFTLVEANSSGLEGSGYFGRTIGATQTEDFLLYLHVPYIHQLRELFDGFGAGTSAADPKVYPGDERMRQVLASYAERKAAAARGGVRELFSAWCEAWLRNWLGSNKPLILPARTHTVTSGTVTTKRVGLLADLYDAMVDNDNGGGDTDQGVADCTVTLGSQSPAYTATGSNYGRVNVGSITYKNYLVPGAYFLECVRSFSSTSDGKETFRLRLEPTSPLDVRAEGENLLTLGAAWESVGLGCAMTVNRGSAVLSGTNFTGDISYTSVSGLTPSNSDDGTLYCSVEDEAPGVGQFTIRVFKSAAGQADQGSGYDDDHADLVAKGTAANAAACTCTEQNGSGLTVVFQSAAAVTASSYNDDVDLMVCSAGDTWRLTGTNDQKGRYAYVFGRLTGIDLGDVVTPSYEWSESHCILDPTKDYTPKGSIGWA